MNRRDFVSQIAVAVAIGASSGPMLGCATHNGLQLSALGPDELDGFLISADQHAAKAAVVPLPGPVEAWLQDHGSATALREGLRTMVLASSFRDLPIELQADPRAQQLLDREGDRMSASVFAIAEMLDNLPEEELRRIQDGLRADPSLADDLVAAVVARAEAEGAPEERRSQLRELFTHVLFRIRTQPPSSVIGEQSEKLDKVARLHGAERRTWRRSLRHALREAPATGTPPTGGTAEDMEDYRRARNLRKAGLVTLGVGGGVSGAGLITFALGLAVGVDGAGAALTVIGLVVILLGLAIAAVGGALAIGGNIWMNKVEDRMTEPPSF